MKFKEEGEENEKKQPQDVTIASISQAFKTLCEPRPISMAEQAIKDKLEEEENKKKENEARAAQEKLEAEKDRLRKEQMQQIKKQEANANKLMVYTKAMTLSFHTKTEDFNQSMSFLSIYHLEIEQNFMHYSSHIVPHFNHPANQQITLQGFFHFLRLMDLASSREEVMQIMQTLS